MNILLTGYRGFIGSHLLRKLKEQNHVLYLCEWGDKFPSVSGLDWVIHVGANSSTTERNIDLLLKQNLDFSIKLYEECKLNNVNFQYASSASVYGLGTAFKEDSPVDPRNPYAWSKYLFERYVQNNPGHILTQGFRYFNVYGTNGEEHKGKQASPFTQFKKQAETQGFITLFENSESYRRDFILVDEVVDIHVKFFSVKESGIWNVGTGKTLSFLDVANTFNVPKKYIPMPKILTDSYQQYTCADTTKIKETLAKNQLTQ